MRHFFTIFLTALCLTLSFTTTAKAVNVTVSGTTYDITLQASTTFNAIAASLTATPWFGNQALAESIALEFHSVTGGDYGLTAGFDSVAFAITDSAPGGPTGTVTVVSISENTGTTTTQSLGKGIFLSAAAAYALGVEVPEINGASLAQALFVLLAFGLILNRRRPRIVA